MHNKNIPINDQVSLNKFYLECLNENILAIDTEFVRENSYHPILCLVQIAGSNFSKAIDPLSGINMEPIWKLLSNRNILKVFHAARQDIEIFFNLTGKIPEPIYDTQIAAMFCGLGEQIGYENLINKLLGLTISKEHQFTNWLQRPLSQKQIDYAISDVSYLIKVFPLIEKKIEEKNRRDWVKKEFNLLQKTDLYQIEPDEAWKKIKIKRSNPEMLFILKNLACWRETECKKRNIPRGRLIRDDVLINLSYGKPKTINEIKKVRAFPKHFSNDDCLMILNIINKCLKNLPKVLHKKIKLKEKKTISKDTLNLLKLLLNYCSQKSGIAEKVIANGDDLRLILEGKKKNVKVFYGWRNEIFGNKVESLLKGKIAFKLEKGIVKKIDI